MKLLLKKLFKLCSTNNTSTTTTTTVSLPINLRKRLENISLERRRAIVSKTRKGCAPLFVACRNGHVNIVKYLILTCDVNVEQKGVLVEESFENIEWRGIFRRAEPYAYFHYRYRFNVTPLWCATAYGYLEIVEFLFQHGADLNSVAERSGFTPVRKACALNRIDLVSFFVRNGADTLQPEKEGVTCLMVSARRNTGEMCEILLRGRARTEINARDREGHTALHYALGKNVSTLKLLLAYGADPFLQCQNGHDALQTACLYQSSEIFEYLRVNVTYTPERLADAYELLGALLFLSDDHPDDPAHITLWRKAAQVRRTAGLMKRVNLKVRGRIFAFTHEFRDEEELDRVLATRTYDADWTAVKTQAFLICERMLDCTGTQDECEWINFLTDRAGSLGTDPKAINLFFHALELKMPLTHTHHLLSYETFFIVEKLVSIFYIRASREEFIDFEDPLVILSFLSRQMINYVNYVNSYSSDSSDSDSDSYSDSDLLKAVTFEMDRTVWEVVKLILILIKISQNKIQAQVTRQLVSDLLRLDLPTSVKANSILYVAIATERYFSITFPTISITSFLLSLGADVNATNVDGSSPLMQAAFLALEDDFYPRVVKWLLEAGAHIDQVMSGKTLREHIGRRRFFALTGIDCFINLKCFAARVIQRYQIPYAGNVPAHLENFIRLH